MVAVGLFNGFFARHRAKRRIVSNGDAKPLISKEPDDYR